MIMKFLQKVPAGLMLVPLLMGAVIHTFFPNVLEIGGLTTAAFSNAGAATCMGLQLFCLGTILQLKDMPAVLKRGGTQTGLHGTGNEQRSKHDFIQIK